MEMNAVVLFLVGCFVATLAVSRYQDESVVQAIKHLQAEGKEFKQRLGMFEYTIQLQKKHILKQDERIKFLENIIESLLGESGDHLLEQNTGQHLPDLLIKNISLGHLIDAMDKGNKHHASRSMISPTSPVAFQAFLSHDTNHIGTRETIIFDRVITSVGGGYHNNHGLFTAPKSGIYIFSASFLLQPRYYMEAEIMKNGNAVKGIYGNSLETTTFAQSSGTVVLQLVSGDEVWVETTQWSHGDLSLRLGDYTSFMGCLIIEI